MFENTHRLPNKRADRLSRNMFFKKMPLKGLLDSGLVKEKFLGSSLIELYKKTIKNSFRWTNQISLRF